MAEYGPIARSGLAFRWLGHGRIPAGFDLRKCGWSRVDPADGEQEDCVDLLEVESLDGAEWIDFLSRLTIESRRHILALDVDCASTRSTLLHIGFGDAVASNTDLGEIAARASRLAESFRWLPKQREIAGLTLDLLAREAFVDSRPLALNPREFALIWRLADVPDQVVSKEDLIHDVWRMGFVPETNSIAVHMSRLRRKLAEVDLAGIVQTVSSGGYCLRSQQRHAARKPRYGNAVRISGPGPGAESAAA